MNSSAPSPSLSYNSFVEFWRTAKIDQFFLGELLAFVIGFMVLYSFFRKREKNNSSASAENTRGLSNDHANDLTTRSSESDAAGNADVIVVGAGVAGSALAYTLAKVTQTIFRDQLMNSRFYQ